MTRQAPFRGADVCLLTGLARHPTKKPQDMVREMLTYIEYTIKKGGSVLLPTYSAGVVHDLLELVVGHLSQTAIRDTSVYFVSPSAKHSLQFANICAHWLCPSKAERVNLPEWPVTTLPPPPPLRFLVNSRGHFDAPPTAPFKYGEGRREHPPMPARDNILL